MENNNKNNYVIKLAIDTMGADRGTEVIIYGADIIASSHKIKFIFVGDKELIQPILSRTNYIDDSEVIHTSDYVKSDEKGSEALRSGKSTSMWVAINLVKEMLPCGLKRIQIREKSMPEKLLENF